MKNLHLKSFIIITFRDSKTVQVRNFIFEKIMSFAVTILYFLTPYHYAKLEQLQRSTKC